MDKNFLENIFSIKKSWDKSHTEIRFCGLKLKMKKKVKPLSYEELLDIQNNYNKIIEQIKNRKNKKIKVAFLVALTSMFPAKPLFERMIKNDNFDVSLIVIPDFRFIPHKVEENQQTTIDELIEYKDIMHVVPIDETDDKINLKELADIVFCSLPYDISHEQYKLKNIIKNGILPALVNYSFYRSFYDRGVIGNEAYSLFWKIFTETDLSHEEYKNYQKIKGTNTLLTGYCKMDDYKQLENKKERKTIIIAPHHSVEGGFNDMLSLSNFHSYSELFLKLPDMYPHIDFIFRPHPALFLLLAQKKYWGEEKVNEYISKLTSKPNMTYNKIGDYLDLFAQSDGIIEDCGSYLVEYFYTNKPHCFMLKSPSDIEAKFTPLGVECLKHCYLAYDEKAIIDFIDNVIVGEQDTMKEQREKFAKEVVMYNYPNASETIIDHIQKQLL